MRSQKNFLSFLILLVCVLILGLLLSFEVQSSSLRKSIDLPFRDSKIKNPQARFSQRGSNNNIWRNIIEGDWGLWEERVSWSEQEGFYACGASVRFEQDQGKGDDTAMNGLKFIICNEKSWGQQQTVTINEGLWGEWTRDVLCPVGSFIIGLQVRYENKIRLGDNTALNGLRIQCNDPSSKWLEVHPGLWGEWNDQIRFPRLHICGAQSRFQPYIRMGDDTGMNGLIVQLCPKSLDLEVVEVVYDLWYPDTRQVGREINSSRTVSNPTNRRRNSTVTFEFSQRKSHQYDTYWSVENPFKFSPSTSVTFGNLDQSNLGIQKEINEFIKLNQTYSFGRETFSPLNEISNYTLVADPCTEVRLTASAFLIEYKISYRMTLVDVFGAHIERDGRLTGTMLSVPHVREGKRVIPNCPRRRS